jgi:ribosomal protein L11 methyltransferase
LLDLCSVDVDDKDWARRSQAALTAVQVGRITIAPPWDAMESLIPDPDTILIVIEPSMGFGTGHHATTRLCLALLQELDVRGKRVIDVGTGSGILALAAWKLGASRVTALDHDPDALQNARENIERNGGTAAIEVVEADVSGGRVNPGSVVLANLTGSVLQRHATGLIQLAGGDGVLVVSGFSPAEVEGIAGAFGLAGRIACGKEVVPIRIVRDGEWAAAVIG